MTITKLGDGSFFITAETEAEAEKRRAVHKRLCDEVIRQALAWNRTGLNQSLTAACNALEFFETGGKVDLV